MRTISIALIVLSTLLFSCGSSDPDSDTTESAIPETVSEVPAIADKGHLLFERKCAACHGSDGAGGIGGAANLRTSKLDSMAIIQTINKGKNAMPSFNGQLTREEMENIASYLTVLRK